MAELTPINFIHRSQSVQYPMLAALRACDAWQRSGLDPGEELIFEPDAARGDEALMKGEIDFILGSHVTPYLRYDEGIPFVYLGQTVNKVDDFVITKNPIDGVEDVRGLRIGGQLERAHHAHGNHQLYVRRAGIPDDGVQWVETGKTRAIEVLSNDIADVVFAGPGEARRAAAAGFSVFQPEPLPMVNGSTMTTIWQNVVDRGELYKKALRALRIGIAYFIDEPEAMKKVMREDVAKTLDIDNEEELDALYLRNSGLLERSLYPDNEAVTNAFELAVLQRPALRGRISPLALWDMHFLREIDAEV